MNALYKPSLGAPGHVTKLLLAEMGKKLTNMNRYLLVITDIDGKCFVLFEHNINHLCIGYVRLPQLTNLNAIFLVLFFLLFFLFFPCYLLLNR